MALWRGLKLQWFHIGGGFGDGDSGSFGVWDRVRHSFVELPRRTKGCLDGRVWIRDARVASIQV